MDSPLSLDPCRQSYSTCACVASSPCPARGREGFRQCFVSNHCAHWKSNAWKPGGSLNQDVFPLNGTRANEMTIQQCDLPLPVPVAQAGTAALSHDARLY